MVTDIKEDQEMYLKCLFEIVRDHPSDPIRTNQVAEAMDVSAASASEMLKRLASKGLLDHVPYKGVSFTEEGLIAASKVKRREGLMEVFLVKMLDYQGDAKEAACRLEHSITDDLEVAIDRLLGYPEATPSGEKIPPVRRKVKPSMSRMLLPLASIPEGVEAKVELMVVDGVESRTLAISGLSVGSTIVRVQEAFEVNGVEMLLSNEMQSKILARTD